MLMLTRYNNTQQLTNKSDIFSLGIVLLELLCGRPPIDRSLPDQTQWNIGEWVKKTYSLIVCRIRYFQVVIPSV
jgi:serine/threonine protein kinase